MNRTMTIEYNDEMLQALALSPKKFQEMVRIHLAVKLYELGGLSTGGGAEFAGMPKTTFLSRMSEYGLDTFVLSNQTILSGIVIINGNDRVRGQRPRFCCCIKRLS